MSRRGQSSLQDSPPRASAQRRAAMSIKADRFLGIVAGAPTACLLCAMSSAPAQQTPSRAVAAMERDSQVLRGGDVTVESIVENLKPSRTRAMRQPLLITFETGSSK